MSDDIKNFIIIECGRESEIMSIIAYGRSHAITVFKNVVESAREIIPWVKFEYRALRATLSNEARPSAKISDQITNGIIIRVKYVSISLLNLVFTNPM